MPVPAWCSAPPWAGRRIPLIARERVTCCGLVPLALLWAQAAATSKYDLSSLQVLQVGGAKLVPEAARRVIDGLGCTLQQVFGMAEGLVNYTRLDDPEDLIVACQGRPISPDDEVRSMTMTSRWPKARASAHPWPVHHPWLPQRCGGQCALVHR